MERSFGDHVFEGLGAIEPERDEGGAIREVGPKSSEGLHRYGAGPFCRFSIARGWLSGGVYVVTSGAAPRYVGMCHNLNRIWKHVGGITPASVRKGGQQTYCRINNLILGEAKRGTEVALWFRAVRSDADRAGLKAKLLAELNPPWNGTVRASRPTPRASSIRRPTEPVGRRAVERSFGGRVFQDVGAIEPERDGRGEVIAYMPQSRYPNQGSLSLHSYGKGPFCRFSIAQDWQRGGVYVLADAGGSPLYVGECKDLKNQWGSGGFGLISPANCYKGGQQTHCRINNWIYEGVRAGAKFKLWFRAVRNDADRAGLKKKLLFELNPPWNR